MTPKFKSYDIEGFPEVSKYIEIPRIEELFRVPMFQVADIDLVYKEGGEIYRKLLEQAPIKGDRKYIGVWGQLQFLQPDVTSISYNSRWHIDSSQDPFVEGEKDRYHLLITDCTARTEFNINPIALTVDEKITMNQLDQYIGKEAEAFGFEPKKIESNHFVTFTPHHAHRAIEASVPEFRFALRIVESDFYHPLPPSQARMSCSTIHRNGVSYKNVEYDRNNHSIIIHSKEGNK